jgi:hypothetical protein
LRNPSSASICDFTSPATSAVGAPDVAAAPIFAAPASPARSATILSSCASTLVAGFWPPSAQAVSPPA